MGFFGSARPVPPEVVARITNCSWRADGPVRLEELRHVVVDTWSYQGTSQLGEVIVHEAVADELVAIFADLYKARFPIEKMRLIDEYNADDILSMTDNNSSALCVRPVTGTTNRWSKHAYGRAIDINPLVNPYVKGTTVLPEAGKPYADRSNDAPGMIRKGDACYTAFVSRGWEWGGDWTSLKDYQHFEKPVPGGSS
eukprot:tig00020710_g13381.t1